MPTIHRFEDLEVWESARILAKRIYHLSQTSDLKHDYGLKNQLLRSSGSIMDNIAEGFERAGKKEFRQFLAIAKGSNGVVRSQLYRLLDRNYISSGEFEEFYVLTLEIGSKLKHFIAYLNRSEIEGSKYKL